GSLRDLGTDRGVDQGTRRSVYHYLGEAAVILTKKRETPAGPRNFLVDEWKKEGPLVAWRSWMMVLLSLVLLLSAGLSIPPTRTEAKGQPVVSPTPQIYKVKKGSIPLSADVEVKTVNVVDEATVKSVRHSLEKGDGKGQ